MPSGARESLHDSSILTERREVASVLNWGVEERGTTTPHGGQPRASIGLRIHVSRPLVKMITSYDANRNRRAEQWLSFVFRILVTTVNLYLALAVGMETSRYSRTTRAQTPQDGGSVAASLDAFIRGMDPHSGGLD